MIYISDNGVAFPGAKTTVYEPVIKLPCLVKDPRTKHRGLVNNALITWADLTPTILDFAAVKFAPADFHGRSFVPILGEKDPKGWTEMYASHNFHELTMSYPMRVVRFVMCDVRCWLFGAMARGSPVGAIDVSRGVSTPGIEVTP